MWQRIPSLGHRLESGKKSPMSGDDLLALLLPENGLLRLGGLLQDLKFGLLILQHAEFGTDSRLQVEDGLLIGGGRNGGDQRLNRCEAAAGIGERTLRQRLLYGAGPARRDEVASVCRGHRRKLRRSQHGVAPDG